MQDVAAHMLGESRWSRFLDEAKGDPTAALDLYTWHSQLNSQLQELLSYLEIAVRNAFDRQLRIWIPTQTPSKSSLDRYSTDWCIASDLPPAIGKLIGKNLLDARKYAQKDSNHRKPDHRRHGQAICHDDVVAQMMFGGWTKLLATPGTPLTPNLNQKLLWDECLHNAFPQTSISDHTSVGARLEAMRQLRNRVAHHDSLLAQDIPRHIATILSLLASMDQRYADIAMARNSIRAILKDDPRNAAVD